MVVTSSTGCAGNNAVGKGAAIHFDSLEYEELEDAGGAPTGPKILEHADVALENTQAKVSWSEGLLAGP